MAEMSQAGEDRVRHIDFVLHRIRRALNRAHTDHLIPLKLSWEISGYLVELEEKPPEDWSELRRFVIALPFQALEEELLRQMILARGEHVLADLRAAQEELSRKKEDAIAEMDFETAAQFHVRHDIVRGTIRELIKDEELVIYPSHLEAALRSLGYQGPL